MLFFVILILFVFMLFVVMFLNIIVFFYGYLKVIDMVGDEKVIVFGGVVIGNIKVNEVDMVEGNMIKMGFLCILIV